ncbi:MAG TPA: NUDIX hydrolase [Rhizomicrobium sp.]|jgi:8-oxo-dGTP pyrophosphatase MutT (NUDIX family)
MTVTDSDNEKIVPEVLRPKDAATLVLVRREGGQVRVLMGQRHGNMAFMANKYVFPGGRMDPADIRVPVSTDLRPEIAAKVAHGITAARARGLALAAVRETFEEAGVLVGERSDSIPRTRAPAWKQFFLHKIMPKLERFDFIARAITPPNRTRRFDARFFMADADVIAHVLDATANEELLQPAWLTLAEARALDLPSITRTVLDEVEARTADGFDGSRPVPFFRFTRGKPQLAHL